MPLLKSKKIKCACGNKVNDRTSSDSSDFIDLDGFVECVTPGIFTNNSKIVNNAFIDKKSHNTRKKNCNWGSINRQSLPKKKFYKPYATYIGSNGREYRINYTDRFKSDDVLDDMMIYRPRNIVLIQTKNQKCQCNLAKFLQYTGGKGNSNDIFFVRNSNNGTIEKSAQECVMHCNNKMSGITKLENTFHEAQTKSRTAHCDQSKEFNMKEINSRSASRCEKNKSELDRRTKYPIKCAKESSSLSSSEFLSHIVSPEPINGVNKVVCHHDPPCNLIPACLLLFKYDTNKPTGDRSVKFQGNINPDHKSAHLDSSCSIDVEKRQMLCPKKALYQLNLRCIDKNDEKIHPETSNFAEFNNDASNKSLNDCYTELTKNNDDYFSNYNNNNSKKLEPPLKQIVCYLKDQLNNYKYSGTDDCINTDLSTKQNKNKTVSNQSAQTKINLTNFVETKRSFDQSSKINNDNTQSYKYFNHVEPSNRIYTVPECNHKVQKYQHRNNKDYLCNCLSKTRDNTNAKYYRNNTQHSECIKSCNYGCNTNNNEIRHYNTANNINCNYRTQNNCDSKINSNRTSKNDIYRSIQRNQSNTSKRKERTSNVYLESERSKRKISCHMDDKAKLYRDFGPKVEDFYVDMDSTDENNYFPNFLL